MTYRGERAKNRRIYDDVLERIQRGELGEGQRLPTERELVALYGVSRPTVTKALSRLQQEGYIVRRAGSGSFVRSSTPSPPHRESTEARYYGLLIPKLGVTEIFEPICARIAQLSRLHNFHLLWGDSAAHSEENVAADMEEGCLRYIEQKVDGLFFVPLELVPGWEDTNQRIVRHLRDAHIPVVVLDSDYLPYPQRGIFDLVGIDNVRAGYRAARHYLDQGARRFDFLCRPYSANTVQARLHGCRLALSEANILMPPEWIHIGEPREESFVEQVLSSGATNIVCANDATAIALMHSAEQLNRLVPRDLRVVGFDNVKYSEYTRIPLTTFHQPCSELGQLAVETMLLRQANPRRPSTTVYAEPEFLLRQSSIIPRL